jgi:hypothetical protein
MKAMNAPRPKLTDAAFDDDAATTEKDRAVH